MICRYEDLSEHDNIGMVEPAGRSQRSVHSTALITADHNLDLHAQKPLKRPCALMAQVLAQDLP